ncbi:hypothetical protein EXN66_Car002552 [Channa argus]|uniref:Uncharacterized protein n=1 Tax=Channa argus TaxID=215402 RepID=A0A6G1P997_CHAAH|nr:hypothetical protein EXN66_Car002552 [Channa argus]
MRKHVRAKSESTSALPHSLNRKLRSYQPITSNGNKRTCYISVWLCRIMLWMKWKMVVDSLRGRRRRLPCSLWFLLLFAAGGLVLFIHQQDLSEMVPQPGPAYSGPAGMKEVVVSVERGTDDAYLLNGRPLMERVTELLGDTKKPPLWATRQRGLHERRNPY